MHHTTYHRERKAVRLRSIPYTPAKVKAAMQAT
jgi:hypothetical protein